jgi:hypothetical protein
MAYPRDVLVSIGLDICIRNDIVIMVQNCIRTYEDFIKVGAPGIKILSILHSIKVSAFQPFKESRAIHKYSLARYTHKRKHC